MIFLKRFKFNGEFLTIFLKDIFPKLIIVVVFIVFVPKFPYVQNDIKIDSY